MIALGVLGIFALIVWSATLFEDDFTTPVEGWLVGPDPQGNASWRFSDGEYQVVITRPQAVTWSLAPAGRSFAEFCVEIDTRQLPVARGEVGLAFGFGTQDNKEIFKTFGIFEDGSYRLGRFTEGQLRDLAVATAPLKLNPAGTGRFNNLRVVAKEGNIEFYGNNQLLATAEAKQVEATGEIGFFGRSGVEPFVTGRFDFIRIMTPDCKP